MGDVCTPPSLSSYVRAGLYDSNRDFAFDRASLKQLFSERRRWSLADMEGGRWAPSGLRPVVYTCVDLCGYGTSHMALTTGILIGGAYIVSLFCGGAPTCPGAVLGPACRR